MFVVFAYVFSSYYYYGTVKFAGVAFVISFVVVTVVVVTVVVAVFHNNFCIY